jgi:hypothetical protein
MHSGNSAYAYNMNQYVRTTDAPTFSQVYVSNWFRNNTNNTGLYNENTTMHWSSKDNGYWDASSTTTVSSIRFWTGSHIGTLRGYVYANTSNEIGFLNNGASWIIRCDSTTATYVTGTVNATGNIVAYYSDERLKMKIGKIDSPLDKILSLNGFKYVNNDIAKSYGYESDEIQIGLSAQEVQNILPELVTLAPFDIEQGEDRIIKSKSGENYLTVNYAKLVPVLVEAIKDLNKKIETQEELIKSLLDR